MAKLRLKPQTGTQELLELLAQQWPDLVEKSADNFWVFQLSDDCWALKISLKRSGEHLSLQLVIQDWCDANRWGWCVKSLYTTSYQASVTTDAGDFTHEAKYPEQALMGAFLRASYKENLIKSKSA